MVVRLLFIAQSLVLGGLLAGCAETQVTPVSTRNLFDDAAGETTSVIDTKLDQYRGLARDYPKEAKYQERLSRLYMEKGDHKTALKHIHKAQKLEPTNAKYNYLEGQIFLTIGNFADAERAYLQMIENTPDGKYSGPYFELATLYLVEDRPIQAAKVLHKCLEVDESFPLPHYHLAEIAALKGEKKTAVHHYEEYLRLDGLRHREAAIRKLYSLQPDLEQRRRGRRMNRRPLPGPTPSETLPSSDVPYGPEAPPTASENDS